MVPEKWIRYTLPAPRKLNWYISYRTGWDWPGVALTTLTLGWIFTESTLYISALPGRTSRFCTALRLIFLRKKIEKKNTHKETPSTQPSSPWACLHSGSVRSRLILQFVSSFFDWSKAVAARSGPAQARKELVRMNREMGYQLLPSSATAASALLVLCSVIWHCQSQLLPPDEGTWMAISQLNHSPFTVTS